MAGHNTVVDGFMENQIRNIEPKTAVDVGAGNGNIGKMIKGIDENCHIIGVEIFGPYIEQFKIYEIYDRIIIDDIKNVINTLSGDLIIFGDVLEHMNKEEAMNIISVAVKNFKHIIINAPCGFMSQEEVNENKYEIHKCGLYAKDFDSFDVRESNVLGEMFNILIKGENNG